MNTLGPDIHAALVSVRRFHRQVALLLRTADAHMAENRLQGLCGATSISDGTASIHLPDKWMPNTAFRFYSRKGAADTVVFVAAIICPRGPESHVRPWREPLISAGWVRLAKAPSKWNQYGWANMITWTDVAWDGTLSRWMPPGGKPCENGSLEQRCLAVPLVAITSTEELVRSVLDPVIASLSSD